MGFGGQQIERLGGRKRGEGGSVMIEVEGGGAAVTVELAKSRVRESNR